jgi:hypothetical protein
VSHFALFFSHLRGPTTVVNDSFMNSFQTFRRVESLSTISQRHNYMAKYTIGDVVRADKGDSGVVRAIFRTMAGELCYAIEREGGIDYCEETRLSASPRKTSLAA